MDTGPLEVPSSPTPTGSSTPDDPTPTPSDPTPTPGSSDSTDTPSLSSPTPAASPTPAPEAGSLEVDPDQVDFGQVLLGLTGTASLEVINNSDETLEILASITSGGSIFELDDSSLVSPLASAATATLELSFAPLVDGTQYGTLTLELPDGSSLKVPLIGSGGDPSSTDADGDGYPLDIDCDDEDDSIHPGAPETANGQDDDCDGRIDNGTEVYDDDHDGYSEQQGDSDDGNPYIYPTAMELPDGLDNDGDGTIDEGTNAYDDDGDGYSEQQGDCDDSSSSVYPGATETKNGEDDNCNGQVDETSGSTSVDADKDGYTGQQGDCNDANATIYPGAVEKLDGLDNNCNGKIDEGTSASDDDGDGVSELEGDCNDANASVSPSAKEKLDGVDNDCDGKIDEGTTAYDDDSDGLSEQQGDCNDADPSIRPGVTDSCNGKDNDCDGVIDDDGVQTYYTDYDRDGYGDNTTAQVSCSPADDQVTQSGDCNDLLSTTYPGAPELCDGQDQDCDSVADEGVQTTWYQDQDKDGAGTSSISKKACTAPAGYVSKGGDCNDQDTVVYPGAVEKCDSVDNDCDTFVDEDVQTLFYKDNDSDGYGDPKVEVAGCSAPAGYVADGTDCLDTDATTNAGATEICNSKDDDCDKLTDEGVSYTFYRDADGDKFGNPALALQSCSLVSGYSALSTDCNDTDATINPAASETCDGKDNDCDKVIDEDVSNTYYLDADTDGYGNKNAAYKACSKPGGYVTTSTDCDDTNKSIYPGATETCNNKDDNCNNTIDEGVSKTWFADADSDGYGASSSIKKACTIPDGYVDNAGDCDDTNAEAHPEAPEVCGGEDLNCDDIPPLCSSCLDLLQGGFSTGNGIYSVDPDGDGPTASFKVFCDMGYDGGGWTMVYKVTRGLSGDPYTLWTDGPVNEADTTLMNLQASSKHFVNRWPTTFWNTVGHPVAKARISLYTGGSLKKDIQFTTSGSSNVNWMDKARLSVSPWVDLTSSSSAQYFSLAGWTTYGRRMYILSNGAGGCSSENGWLWADTTPDLCTPSNSGTYFEYTPPGIRLYYSAGNGVVNWHTAYQNGTLGQADIMVIWVR